MAVHGDIILFLVRAPDSDRVVIVQSIGREQAKHRAFLHLHGNVDHYIVTPLTRPGDKIIYVDIGG